MRIPEVTLKLLIDRLILAVATDYNGKADEQKTFLYKIFNGNVIEGYNYYTQAKALFLRPDDDPRKLATRIFFDRSRASCPTLHITLPSENPIGDGVTFDKGYSSPTFDDAEGTFQEENTRTTNTRYSVIATSDNSFEVLILFYLLKALIVSNIDLFELNGIRNIKMSGQDLMIQDHLMPTNVYMRGLGIECFYEFSVPEFDVSEMLTAISFEGAMENVTGDIPISSFDITPLPIFIQTNK